MHPFPHLCSMFSELCPFGLLSRWPDSLLDLALTTPLLSPGSISPSLRGLIFISLQLSFPHLHHFHIWLCYYFQGQIPSLFFLDKLQSWKGLQPCVTSTLVLAFLEFPYETQGPQLFSSIPGLELVSCSSSCHNTPDHGVQLFHCSAMLLPSLLTFLFFVLSFLAELCPNLSPLLLLFITSGPLNSHPLPFFSI